jgi:hypothetical protein
VKSRITAWKRWRGFKAHRLLRRFDVAGYSRDFHFQRKPKYGSFYSALADDETTSRQCRHGITPSSAADKPKISRNTIYEIIAKVVSARRFLG